MLAVFQTVGMFGKEFKYTLGEKLKNETLEIINNNYPAKPVASPPCWRPNQHIVGRFGIQYDEMDEDKTIRIFMSYFSLVFIGNNFVPGKYPTLLNE